MGWKLGQKIIDKFRLKNEQLQIHGEGNEVDIPKIKNLKITIWGNNNSIYIDKSITHFQGTIGVGFRDCPVNNCSVVIKGHTTANGVIILLLEDNSSVEIGSNCMFSSDIQINCTDTHAIYDKDTGELLNKGKFIEIGNHVWLGRGSLVCKNTKIPANCVVGANSVVTKIHEEENCILAGVPASIKKRNINWVETRPQNYERQLIEKMEIV